MAVVYFQPIAFHDVTTSSNKAAFPFVNNVKHRTLQPIGIRHKPTAQLKIFTHHMTDDHFRPYLTFCRVLRACKYSLKSENDRRKSNVRTLLWSYGGCLSNYFQL
ncbi:hypothetical protein J6590_094421 [Homalodisca vitripennis]|nr:hypothetical protein J6590_094421 [Homalodisca vitripennis]